MCCCSKEPLAVILYLVTAVLLIVGLWMHSWLWIVLGIILGLISMLAFPAKKPAKQGMQVVKSVAPPKARRRRR